MEKIIEMENIENRLVVARVQEWVGQGDKEVTVVVKGHQKGPL